MTTILVFYQIFKTGMHGYQNILAHYIQDNPIQKMYSPVEQIYYICRLKEGRLTKEKPLEDGQCGGLDKVDGWVGLIVGDPGEDDSQGGLAEGAQRQQRL